MRGRGRTRPTVRAGSVVEMPVQNVRVGQRHRKDMGDLKGLARSIDEYGLLQPVGVTEDMVLVFGERRLRAVRDILKRRTIAARVVRIRSIVAGEYVENEVRKDFTVSERVAIAKALEREAPERRGRPGKNRHRDDAFQDGRTDDRVAELTGFESRQSYRQAKKVVERGSSKLILAMDEGRVSITAAALLAEADADQQDAILELDEQAVLRAAKEIRQRRTAHRNGQQRAAEQRARAKANGHRAWTITRDQSVVPCNLLLADPPFGLTSEPWEPKDVETFTRGWSSCWSACGADFVAVFWCQGKLWEGRRWLDESLAGYTFQQLLVWHSNNHCGPKSRRVLKQTWYPIFLYRRNGSSRQVIVDGKVWSAECHQLDCHVAPVPQTGYRGHDLKQHPCQKPVSVMRWLINALSEPGELVASLCCGVAPCGIAAVQLGRRYHGVEASAQYRRLAEARIAAYGGPV
jgi:ParB-like chromosome segregation protein Spo0J